MVVFTQIHLKCLLSLVVRITNIVLTLHWLKVNAQHRCPPCITRRNSDIVVYIIFYYSLGISFFIPLFFSLLVNFHPRKHVLVSLFAEHVQIYKGSKDKCMYCMRDLTRVLAQELERKRYVWNIAQIIVRIIILRLTFSPFHGEFSMNITQM